MNMAICLWVLSKTLVIVMPNYDNDTKSEGFTLSNASRYLVGCVTQSTTARHQVRMSDVEYYREIPRHSECLT